MNPELVIDGSPLSAALVASVSGARPTIAERPGPLLKARIKPVVPETGSVGASGDLAPLAHIALVLIGEGEAWSAGGRDRLKGAAALRTAGLEPIALEAKEGLA